MFISVFGFTQKAKLFAEENGVTIMESGDFVRFFLSGKLRPSLASKLQIPNIALANAAR
jgi:hypothetical protein